MKKNLFLSGCLFFCASVFAQGMCGDAGVTKWEYVASKDKKIVVTTPCVDRSGDKKSYAAAAATGARAATDYEPITIYECPKNVKSPDGTCSPIVTYHNGKKYLGRYGE